MIDRLIDRFIDKLPGDLSLLELIAEILGEDREVELLTNAAQQIHDADVQLLVGRSVNLI